ncbi:hypothetical protein ACTAQJ_18405 [Arthrobacter sp. alpha11c]
MGAEDYFARVVAEHFEHLEDEADIRDLHEAKAEDDGTRVGLDDLLKENGITR